MSVLVGKPAPDFKATAVMPNNTFQEIALSQYRGQYVVLFFWPLDFTFVCPTELIAFDRRLKEFAARKTQVLGISVDSEFSHLAWKNTPVNKGGIGNVQYPMVADIRKSIARDYDVLVNESVALRGSFLIDDKGVVRHQVVNDLPLGRNIDEMIRMVDALRFFEENGEVCPAGWNKGEKGMKASADGVANYLGENAGRL